MASPFTSPKVKFFTTTGTLGPLVGGKLWTYQSGTSTPLATYTDQGGLTPKTNPIILDANGEAEVWLGTSAYRFVLTDAADVVQPGYPIDGITSIEGLANAAQAAAQAFATAADTVVKTTLRAEIVAQTNTYYVTSGTSPNFLLTPTTALGSYTAGVRFSVKFHATALTGATLNVSALGAKDIKGYNSLGSKVSPVIYINQIFDVEYDGTDFILLGYISRGSSTSVRQCLQSSRTADGDTGLPNFLPVSSANLTIVGSASTSAPIIVSAAGGFDSLGPLDRWGISTANLSWTVPANSTSHLYVDVAENGVLTTGSTTSSPFYDASIPTATKNTSNVVCFDIARMEMTIGTGTNNTKIWRVYLGKAVSNATAVTSIISTYLRDGFRPPDNNALAAASTKITLAEIYPPVTYAGYGWVNMVIVCRSPNLGYSIGSEVPFAHVNNGAGATYATPIFSAFMEYQTTSGTATIATYSTGAQASLDVGKWNVKCYFSRGW